MVSFARKPTGVPYSNIWRRPTRFDNFKAAVFGWHQVHGGSYDPDTGEHTSDREYFPPAWLVWVKNKFATVF